MMGESDRPRTATNFIENFFINPGQAVCIDLFVLLLTINRGISSFS